MLEFALLLILLEILLLIYVVQLDNFWLKCNKIAIMVSFTVLTLSCPGKERAVVKIGNSNLWSGSKELYNHGYIFRLYFILYQ